MNTKVENELVNQSGERLISKQELACRLKKSLRTISKWQRCGIIPFVKCRRAVFYDWQSVLEHLQKRQQCESVPHSVAADVSPRVTEPQMPESKGPVRLPVYQMREERRTKCRRLIPPRGTAPKRHGNHENQNITKT